MAHLFLNIFLSQAGPAFTANPVKRYAGHKDGVWEVKVIHHLTSKIKNMDVISAKKKEHEMTLSKVNHCNCC